jgi:hypothetical protein
VTQSEIVEITDEEEAEIIEATRSGASANS